MGEYDPVGAKATNVRVIEPPTPTTCDKNWSYVPNKYLDHNPEAKGRANFIYGLHPLQIGAVDPEDNKLKIHTVQNTPTSWTHFRGSSNLVEYNDKLYCVTHHVKYSTPRIYLHSVVEFSTEMKPLRYTPFFTFRKTTIEYCLGLQIKNEMATFLVSEYDSNPGVFQVPFKRFNWLDM